MRTASHNVQVKVAKKKKCKKTATTLQATWCTQRIYRPCGIIIVYARTVLITAIITVVADWSLTALAVAVCIPVRNKSSPKERAMHRLRWTKLWTF